uniref:U1-type domain-containing protein n=3 Tax=Brassica campestris TaxID=3711 RepID=M4FE91_BRACM
MIETEAVERKRSRGGFLTLFDWSGKSRKKLLSSTTTTSGPSEASKQEKQNAQNPSKSSSPSAELEETGKSVTYSPRRDSSCSTSTVTSDDRQGSRAPSVVARLMGLESLPIPNSLEQPRSNPDFDPFFLSSSRKASTWDAYESLGYVNLRSHYDGVSWDHLDSRTNNNEAHRLPINRFQTETLPPKSAKPISVTHNRLLSPIRSPGFVQSRNPAQVMEAASRMIEPSPRIAAAKARFSSSSEASSSIPMRIRDLREKLEASQNKQTPQISNGSRNNNKYLRGKNETSSLKTQEANKLLGKTGRVKPPSVSAAHTKANSIHKQESSTPSSSTNRAQKEKIVTKNRIVKKDLASTRKTVAKQNNQKQNQPALMSISKQKSSKVMNKVVNKVLVESGTSSKKPGPKKNLPCNKKPANGVQEPGVISEKLIKRGEKLKKCNISVEGDRKKDMDVISFTFSSPIKGISSTKRTTDQERDSALSLSAINGDSLNILLEQKLRELTSKIESSSSGLTQEGESSGSISKDWVNGTISLPSDDLDKVSSEGESVSDCTSFFNNRKFQAEEQEVNSFGTEAEDLQISNSHNEIEETELSESVTLAEAEEEGHRDWELEYITEIISSNQLMVKEISLGMATDILPWSLFDELESKRDPRGNIERKTLFEFVNECLTLKCEKTFMGSCRGSFLFGRKEVLAEEVKREIERLKKMREMMMVDELVDSEMSSFEGRWLDYKREAYEEGSEIEEEILSDLVDDASSHSSSSPMASSNTTPGVDNTFRKKFDTEEYRERARKREEKEADRSKSQPKGPPVQRAPLKHRDYHVDLESRLGKTQVVTPVAPLSQQAGYFCRVCDCVVKDSANYLDHINGKKHQRALGMSMRVERSSLEQVQERFEVLKKRKTPGTFSEQDLDERIRKQQEEEEEHKRQRREKKKEKKKGKVIEEEPEMDPEVAELMGFGGFGSSKKS